MGFGAWWHWVIVIGVVAQLFGGKGKLTGLMGDAAKGIKSFQEGLKGESKVEDQAPSTPLPRTETKTEDKIVS